MPMREFTRDEVSRHSTRSDLWIIIDNNVYDMSDFIDMHPGGAFPILEFAGKDATDAFYGLHRQDVLQKYTRYKIGTIAGEYPQIYPRVPGELSTVPYGEHSAWMGFVSPYFDASHYAWRISLRKVVEEFAEEARQYDTAGVKPPNEFLEKMGSHGLIAANVGPGPWMKGITLPGGLKGEDYDFFHEMITHQEFSRWGTPGLSTGIFSATNISIPTVLHFGKAALKAKVVPEIFSGKKRMALAITEPYTGSDVSNIKTTAVRTTDGWVVNGVKKWITAGHFADYFAVAVRTENGISMILIERGEGIETKPIKTSYSSSAGTAYVTFDNVKVPFDNLIGEESQGLFIVLSNFNHERWTIIAGATMAGRLAVEECMKWAHQRKVFGKRLIDQPVIRNKLAKMIALVESCQNWTDNITYQMCHMNYKEQATKLAGPLAILKYHISRMLHDISDDACQIFGGRALTQTGMGRYVESLQRTYKFTAILGGSEEVMADLGVRQAMKHYPSNARL